MRSQGFVQSGVYYLRLYRYPHGVYASHVSSKIAQSTAELSDAERALYSSLSRTRMRAHNARSGVLMKRFSLLLDSSTVYVLLYLYDNVFVNEHNALHMKVRSHMKTINLLALTNEETLALAERILSEGKFEFDQSGTRYVALIDDVNYALTENEDNNYDDESAERACIIFEYDTANYENTRFFDDSKTLFCERIERAYHECLIRLRALKHSYYSYFQSRLETDEERAEQEQVRIDVNKALTYARSIDTVSSVHACKSACVECSSERVFVAQQTRETADSYVRESFDSFSFCLDCIAR